jgi:hypothetical protein
MYRLQDHTAAPTCEKGLRDRLLSEGRFTRYKKAKFALLAFKRLGEGSTKSANSKSPKLSKVRDRWHLLDFEKRIVCWEAGVLACGLLFCCSITVSSPQKPIAYQFRLAVRVSVDLAEKASTVIGSWGALRRRASADEYQDKYFFRVD